MNPFPKAASNYCECIISKKEMGGSLNRGHKSIVLPIIIKIGKNRRPSIHDGIDSRHSENISDLPVGPIQIKATPLLTTEGKNLAEHQPGLVLPKGPGPFSKSLLCVTT